MRNYHLARQLARDTRISLLAFSDNDTPATQDQSHVSTDEQSAPTAVSAGLNSAEPSTVAPERFYEGTTVVARDRSYTLGKIVRGALGQTPLPLLNYTTTAMKQSLERLLSEGEFDVVQIESIHLLAYLPIIRAARSRPLVILDWHNIESDLLLQYSGRAGGTLRRAYARRTARQLNRLERLSLKEFDAHVVVSENDRARLLDYSTDAPIFVIENGVDTDYYSDKRIESAYAAWLAQQNETGPTVRNRVVFVASMDYHANSDAALNFAREVWPAVYEQRPDLMFTIVGRNPPAEVRQLAMLPGIEVTGTVDDVRPYYREALAAVIPLRVGGGSRLKILEAMAAGVPVVSKTLGAEGLDVENEQNIMIANANQELSEAIIVLADDSERRNILSLGGRALVSARYDWSSLGDSLFKIYQSLTDTKQTSGAG